VELHPLRFRRELLPQHLGARPDQGQAAGVDLARLWITIFSYAISIPLGIRKAVKDGSTFDVWTSGVIIVGYAIPSFLFGILLIVLFAGGSFWDWFPLRGLVSDNFDQLAWWQKIVDYFWHMTCR
jgi:microcin C transport system permease protein